MQEIRLIAVFLTCAAILVINGIYAVRSSGSPGSLPRIYFIVPVQEDTSDIEFIVRQYIYKAAEQYPEIVIIFYDLGASKDTIRIFEQLMEFSCDYYIVNEDDI